MIHYFDNPFSETNNEKHKKIKEKKISTHFIYKLCAEISGDFVKDKKAAYFIIMNVMSNYNFNWPLGQKMVDILEHDMKKDKKPYKKAYIET